MAFAALTIDLNARLAKFEEDMARAGRSLDGLNNRASALASGFKASLGALGIAVSGGALIAFAKQGIDAADALNDMSIRTGVAVKDLASFKLAAEQSGTSLDSVAKGVSKLTKSIGEAERGNKGMADALRELGVTAKDPKEAFFQLADAVEKIQDPTRRAALLSATLGKSYQELIPLLVQGSDALRKSARDSETFAEAMSRLAPEADKFNDSLAQLKTNAAGAAAVIISDLIPAMNQVLENINQAMRLGKQGFGYFEVLGLGINPSGIAADQLREVGKSVKDIAEDIERLRRNSGGMDSSIPVLEARLAKLRALQEVLIEQEVERLMEPVRSQRKPMEIDVVVPRPAAKTKTAKDKLDDIDPFYKQRIAALKAYQDQIDETDRMMNDHLLETMNQVNYESVTAWEEAGTALTESLMTPMEQYTERLEYLEELYSRGAISLETLDRAKKAAFDALPVDEFAKRMEDASRDIERSLTDALLRGFEGGADFAKNFVDTLKNLFSTLVLRPIIQPIAQGAAGLVTGALGMGASGSAFASGGGSMLGGISNLLAPGAISQSIGMVAGGIAETLGASSAIAGSIGAGVATAIPYIGIAIAIATALGVFDKKPSNKAAGGSVDLGSGNIGDLWAMSGDKTPSQGTLDLRTSLLQSIGGFSSILNRMGGTLGGNVGVDVGERDGIQFIINGLRKSYGTDINGALGQLFGELAKSAEGLSGSLRDMLFYFGGTGEEFATFAAGLLTLQEYMEANPMEAAAEAAEIAGRSAWKTWEAQGVTLRQALIDWDGSASATAELAAMTQARYQVELTLAAQIHAALQSTQAMFSSTIDELRFSVLDVEGQYNFLRDKSAELETALKAALDPAEIESLAQELNAVSKSAWQLLGEEERKIKLAEYEAYLTDIDRITTERLNAAGGALNDDRMADLPGSITSAIEAAMDRVAAQFMAAANAQQAAADTPIQVNVSVDQPADVEVAYG